MNWADFLHAGCDGSFWLEHESCSLSLGFKYWDSTVVVLHCSYTCQGDYLILVSLIVCLVFSNIHGSILLSLS